MPQLPHISAMQMPAMPQLPSNPVRDLGQYIREQRRTSQISLRQLALQAGVSNPYLSQIERGLRKPSAEILQQIAKALRISAEALYVQAGILEERGGDADVLAAIMRDAGLTERQKQVLLEIYESFRKENGGKNVEGPIAVAIQAAGQAVAAEPDMAPASPRKAAASRSKSTTSRRKPATRARPVKAASRPKSAS